MAGPGDDFDLEAKLKEALTPEAWAQANDFPDSVITGDGLCMTCHLTVKLAVDRPEHIAWHRRLTLAVRSQGYVLTQILKLLDPDA